MQPSQSLYDFVAWPEIKVVGVCQNNLDTRILQLLRRDCFYRTLGPHRHKDRSFKTSVGGFDLSQPGAARPALMNNSKFQCMNIDIAVKRRKSKESWPKGSGFGLPLKGTVLLKAVQVKSV
jgi:hypothetical protein